MVEGHETVFILLGTNDFTLESTIGTPNTQIFASRLILVGEYLVNERGVSEVILLGPMDKFDDLPGPANPYYLSDEVQFACWFYPWLVCGPNFQDVISFEHYDPTDGIHPNGAGHEVMAQEVLNYVPESSFQANMFIGTLIVILMKCRNSKWELKFAK
jgi:hypothetical protein